MSLWSVPLESLTFEQLDEFLVAKLPEGSRLDYKLDMPNELEKIIAGFANTLGGLIVLGVDEDAKTTEPVWPPHPTAGKGMPTKRGLREQVINIARDAIYPPVNVRISPVIENKHLPGHVLLVVRVDESRDAPHAVEKRREVYIYARDGCTTPPYRLAEVDRIAYLLERRKSIEEERERMLNVEIDRAFGILKGSECPLRWASVIPFYPWRPLCCPSLYYQLHPQLTGGRDITHTVRQQMPDGSYVRGEQYGPNGPARSIFCNRLHSKGLIFEMGVAAERAKPDNWLDFTRLVTLLQDVIAGAATLYRHERAEQPGLVMVSLGMLGVLGSRLHFPFIHNWKSRNPFLDDSYRADHLIDASVLLERPHAAGSPLLEQVSYSFDMPPLEQHEEFFCKHWGKF